MTRAEYPTPRTLDECLRMYERKFGGPGVARPACGASADYECPTCRVDVRGVTRDVSRVLACPLCGGVPGALTLGRGPSGNTTPVKP